MTDSQNSQGFSVDTQNLYPMLISSPRPTQGDYSTYHQGGYIVPPGYQSGFHQEPSTYPGGNIPQPPYSQKPKEKEGSGFFSSFFSNPVVSQAVSGIIAGQIAKTLKGESGGNNNGYGSVQGYQQPGGYTSPATHGNRGGESKSGNNILGGILSSVLSGGGANSGSSGASSLLGSLLSGGGGTSSASGLGEILGAKNFRGLFNENPSIDKNTSTAKHPGAPST